MGMFERKLPYSQQQGGEHATFGRSSYGNRVMVPLVHTCHPSFCVVCPLREIFLFSSNPFQLTLHSDCLMSYRPVNVYVMFTWHISRTFR